MALKSIVRGLIARFWPSFLYERKAYAQDGEDLLLDSFLELRGKQYRGFYVDIGAHDPHRFSNTNFFYKKGWQGINIEPTPSLLPAFRRNRKRDINLNLGVAGQAGKLTFFEFNEPALNSFDETLSLARDADPNLARYKIVAKHEIPVLPLAQILDKNLPKGQHIDFFNIDVEGLDLQVLQSNDWTRYRPDYILAEGDFQAEALSQDPIYRFMKETGYRLVGRTRRTFLFQRNELNE